MSDIKMSDVFSGELKLRAIDSDDFSGASHNESFFVIEDDSDWCCSGENHINQAIHAISSHDKLTEQNKMLREALSLVVDKMPAYQGVMGGGYMMIVLSDDDCRIIKETLNTSEL